MKIINNFCIGQTIHLSTINESSPETIIFNLCKKSKIKGLRYSTNNIILPIIELNDQTRIWVFPNEINHIN
jgi:hypothetical protein